MRTIVAAAAGALLALAAVVWGIAQRNDRLRAEGQLELFHEQRLKADSAAADAERQREDSLKASRARETALARERDAALAAARGARARRDQAVSEAEGLRAAVDRAAADLLAAGDSMEVAEKLRALLDAHVAEVDRWKLALSQADFTNEGLERAVAVGDSLVAELRTQLGVTEAARIAQEKRAEALTEEVRALEAARPGFFERALWRVIVPGLAFFAGLQLD